MTCGGVGFRHCLPSHLAETPTGECEAVAAKENELCLTPPWRQPRGKWIVSLANSHTNAISQSWNLWKIDLRFAPGLPPGWHANDASVSSLVFLQMTLVFLQMENHLVAEEKRGGGGQKGREGFKAHRLRVSLNCEEGGGALATPEGGLVRRSSEVGLRDGRALLRMVWQGRLGPGARHDLVPRAVGRGRGCGGARWGRCRRSDRAVLPRRSRPGRSLRRAERRELVAACARQVRRVEGCDRRARGVTDGRGWRAVPISVPLTHPCKLL